MCVVCMYVCGVHVCVWCACMCVRYRATVDIVHSILSSHGTYRLTASKSRRMRSSWLIRICMSSCTIHISGFVHEWLIHIPSECKTESSKDGTASSGRAVHRVWRFVTYLHIWVRGVFTYHQNARQSRLRRGQQYRGGIDCCALVTHAYIRSSLTHRYNFARCVIYLHTSSWHTTSWLIHIYKFVRCHELPHSHTEVVSCIIY